MADSVTGTRPDVLLIGDFEVDPAALEVRRDGHSSRLEPKVMDVLLLLASHAGEVVTRTDFEHAVWAGRVVGYDALANAISKLRREFGDTGRQRSYIETVSKTGYRLVAPVRRPEEVAHFVQLSRSGTGTSSPSLQQPARGVTGSSRHFDSCYRTPGAYRAGLVVHLLAARASSRGRAPGHRCCAIRYPGGHGATGLLANGIANDLITDLSKFGGLRVIARDTGALFRDQVDGDWAATAMKLGVRYLVDGSVQRAGDRLRINARLRDVDGERVLWAERYDRQMSDLLSLQDDLVGRIVNALRLSLDTDLPALRSREYDPNVEAYDAFLRGQEFAGRRSPEGYRLAQEAYLDAIRLDPQFARPYIGMALVYSQGFIDGWVEDATDALEKTHDYVDKARALAPDSPQLLFAQGLLALRERQYTESLRFARQAIRISPSYADACVLIANTLVYLGKSAEALSVMVDAERLNPRMPSIYLRIRGTAHYAVGDYLQAIADFERSRETNPNYQQLRVWLAAAYAASGRIDDANWEFQEVRTLNPLITMAWVRRLMAMIDPALRDKLLADPGNAGLPE